ncbi:MAG: hypothetical protein ACC634_06265 [Hyphomicrobiales bacterium]
MTFKFLAIGQSRTRITVSADFEMKFGVLGKLLSPIMRRQLGSGLASLLDGNAAFVEGVAEAA